MDKVQRPKDEDITEIFTKADNSTCQGPMQWTVWNSASDADNGNDFEILADHQKFFGYVTYDMSKRCYAYYSVCSQPTHIEARSKTDKSSWLGTQTTLIFDNTPKPEPNRNWSYGISRNFGLICYQKLQPEGIHCPDFEIRFCCDESYKQQNSSMDLLR